MGKNLAGKAVHKALSDKQWNGIFLMFRIGQINGKSFFIIIKKIFVFVALTKSQFFPNQLFLLASVQNLRVPTSHCPLAAPAIVIPQTYTLVNVVGCVCNAAGYVVIYE